MLEKITYLVTNYNNSKYVAECLSSIVNQSNNNWECLVIDDCSTDNSVQIIRGHLSSKLKLIENSRNHGQIKSIQKLFNLVKTDIVGIIDSDDAIHPDTTKYVLNAFSISRRIGLVYTNCIEYEENLKTPISIGQAEKIPFGPSSSIIFGRVPSMRAFRLSCYNKTEGYDTKLKYAEDLDLVYKLEEVCLPYYVNMCLYKYRYVPNSRSRKQTTELEMIENHRRAKFNALRRRRVNSGMKYLYYSIIYSEYYSKKSKCLNHKVRKKLSQTLYNRLKSLAHALTFKTLKFH
jgi:glycosyltransferase involved in cell wall biosynthesis